jgi:hypothetical protein
MLAVEAEAHKEHQVVLVVQLLVCLVVMAGVLVVKVQLDQELQILAVAAEVVVVTLI